MLDREEHFSELRNALTHLHDPLYLENLQLARRISFIAQAPHLSRGQNLRRTLRLAIAALDPSADRAADVVEARSYQVLCSYAISKESMVAIASRLNISRRQAYRELRRATEALAQVLNDLTLGTQPRADTSTQDAPSRAAKVRAELERLSEASEQDVDLGRLLRGVVEDARSLADVRGLQIRLLDETTGLHVATNRVMLRQAILNLLSHVICVHRGDGIVVLLQCYERNAHVQFKFRPEASADLAQPESPYAVATQLLRMLGVHMTRINDDDGTTEISLCVPLSKQHTVFIVDDSQGVIALFKRYLRNQPYHVYGARDHIEVRDILDRLQPDAVILDVMLPHQDGWEVLRGLRATDSGKAARVIICSIINDPNLAAALGGDAFLHKPVSRARLLQTLQVALSSSP